MKFLLTWEAPKGTAYSISGKKPLIYLKFKHLHVKKFFVRS